MKKQIHKKLSLSKETLRNLSERELAGVVGGACTATCCNSCPPATCRSDCQCATDFCTNASNCC